MPKLSASAPNLLGNYKNQRRYVYDTILWQRVRQAAMIRAKFRCERCGEIARQVHHKRKIINDLQWRINAFSMQNVEALCKECHQARHRRHRKGKRVLPWNKALEALCKG